MIKGLLEEASKALDLASISVWLFDSKRENLFQQACHPESQETPDLLATSSTQLDQLLAAAFFDNQPTSEQSAAIREFFSPQKCIADSTQPVVAAINFGAENLGLVLLEPNSEVNAQLSNDQYTLSLLTKSLMMAARITDLVPTEADQNSIGAAQSKAPFESEPAANETESRLFDMDVVREMAGPVTDRQMELLQSFLSASKRIFRNIHVAIEQMSQRRAQTHIVRLKTSARAIGARAVVALCEAVQKEVMREAWVAARTSYAELDEVLKQLSVGITDFCNEEALSGPMIGADELSVLVLDDDPFFIELLGSMLEQVGVNNVSSATTGQDALDLLSNKHNGIHMILCDLNMPAMDGIEFLRHVAEMGFAGAVVLISGENERVLRSVEMLAKARKLNILGAVEKPLKTDQLRTFVLEYQRSVKPTGVSRTAEFVEVDDIKEAISNRAFDVHFQPKVSVRDKKIHGAEVLVRWFRDGNRTVPPDSFIPIAEEFGLINGVTDIVFDKALAHLANVPPALSEMTLGLNVSVDSLDRLDFPEYIVEMAESHKVDARRLILEVTESRLMSDITIALDILARLSIKGVQLSIDDFGTGYSSMEQLQRAPFNELKIDRAFVVDACNDKASRAIVESSVELARKLGMVTIAEGIETEEDWKLMSHLGVDFAQGYYVARPMSFDDFCDWVEDWQCQL